MYDDYENTKSPSKSIIFIMGLLLIFGIVASAYVVSTENQPDSFADIDQIRDEVSSITEGPTNVIADDSTAAAEPYYDEPFEEVSYEARLTCRFAGQNTSVSVCLYSSGGDVHGELKVSNNGSVKQYAATELAQMFDNQITIDLGSSFEIAAQAGSDENAVLRLEILDGDRVVFEDEASGFGVVGIESWQLGE